MKIKHNTRGWNPDRTDPVWAEKVEREAERITDQTEQRWHKAQERLRRACERAETESHRRKPDPKKVARLWAAVDARRAELREVERAMRSSPAGSQNRGKGSHRGVARGEAW